MKAKNILIALTLFFSLSLILSESQSPDGLKFIRSKKTVDDPLFVVTLMIKDEESVIIDTLKPFVQAGIDSFFIYDTGSTDKTISVVKNYFKENKIKNGIIAQEKFIDYGTSRNKALHLTEEQFPKATFILMVDSEWYTQNVTGLINFCKEHKQDTNNTVGCYNIRLQSNRYEFYTPRLIRCKSGNKFKGRIHEIIDIPAEKIPTLPKDIYFKYTPSPVGLAKTQARLVRDRDILLQDYAEDPKNTRTIYYLAQSYFCLEDDVNAEKYYKLHTTYDNTGEYAYLSWYHLGLIEHLRYNKNKDHQKWLNGLNYFMKAYTLRPWRAEPLVRIAQHYFVIRDWPLCFTFARQAAELPYPENEFLNVDTELYNYERFNILAVSSWFVNKFEIGLAATKKALEAKPEEVLHKKNLDLYIEAIKNKHKNN